MRLYARTFDAKTRKWLEGAPEGWLQHDTCLRYNLAGHDVVLRVREPVVVPSAGYYSRLRAFADEALRDEHAALDNCKTDLKQQRRKLGLELGAMVARFGTLARLREAWPEGEPFWRHLVPRERVEVPAVQVSAINEALGLTSSATRTV